ncbi:MAG: M42 family peptidase [Anaerolineae bacterium]|nr:MAG: M42 family peptidase [Anaerolineae bacterium]
MQALLEKLTQIPGPSGAEHLVRSAVQQEIEGFADAMYTDALGNLLARKGRRTDGGLRVMVAAHLDEIGVIVTHVDENGFVRFAPLGGVSPRYAPGGRVRFLNGVGGVIGLERTEDRTSAPPLEKMFIDVGAGKRSDCPVAVGDVAVFERPFEQLGGRWISKAMDDRVGVALLIEALKRLGDTPHEVYFVFSAQEEVGVRGATTAAFGVEPDLGLAVDVTMTGDTPKGVTMEVALGKGPAVKVKDRGMIADPRVVRWMTRTAERSGIPYQREILEYGSTDGRAIQLSRAGTPTGVLSIPCRYVHSPSEMVDAGDVKQALDLLLALLSAPIELGD